MARLKRNEEYDGIVADYLRSVPVSNFLPAGWLISYAMARLKRNRLFLGDRIFIGAG